MCLSPEMVKNQHLADLSSSEDSVNEKQARKDEQDRKLIIKSLKEQLKKGPKALVGNRGHRKYLTLDSEDIAVDDAMNLSPLSRQKIGLHMVHCQATCFNCCFNSSLK